MGHLDLSISNFTNIVAVTAMCLMIYALWLAIQLKEKIPAGGVVGRTWKMLIALVALFTVGYIVLPFLKQVPNDVLILAVGGIFLFGAVYVIITINLIYKIIRALTE